MTAYRLTVTMTLQSADKPDADDYRWKRAGHVESVIPASEVTEGAALVRLGELAGAITAAAGVEPWLVPPLPDYAAEARAQAATVADAETFGDEVGTIPAFPDEPTITEPDPGPEVDDEGGMSEARNLPADDLPDLPF